MGSQKHHKGPHQGKQQGPKQQPGASSAGPAAADGGAVPAVPENAQVIDGSMLEGGGQILRNAAALAAITGQTVAVDKIRAGRRNPGLSPQHLTGLRIVASMCGGDLAGGAPRSSRIVLSPGHLGLLCGPYLADTGTAGSCTLMAQQTLPCMVFASPPQAGTAAAAGAGGVREAAAEAADRWSQLDLRGGTDAAFAPPVGYLTDVLAPTLSQLLPASVAPSVQLSRRGFYPRGGGAVVVRARALAAGESLPPLDVTQRGRLKEIRVLAFSAGRVAQSDAQRMAAAAAEVLQEALRDPARSTAVVPGAAVAGEAAGETAAGKAAASTSSVQPSGVRIQQNVTREGDATAVGDGGGLLLVAESDTGRLWGASRLWERGSPPGAAGREAAEELLGELESGACVDQWMQDQLIIWMALAKGTSRMVCCDPTLHTRTAMVVAEALLPGAKFTVRPLSSERVHGSGRLPPPGGSGSGRLHLIECRGAGLVAQAGGAHADGTV